MAVRRKDDLPERAQIRLVIDHENPSPGAHDSPLVHVQCQRDRADKGRTVESIVKKGRGNFDLLGKNVGPIATSVVGASDPASPIRTVWAVRGSPSFSDEELKKLAKDFEELRSRLGESTMPQVAAGGEGTQLEVRASS